VSSRDNGTREENEREFSNHAGTAERHFGIKLQIRTVREPVSWRSTDDVSELDEDYTISTVPAFTDAASAASKPKTEKKDGDVADTKITPRPLGQSAFKPG
jgi:hypothetical protein